MPGFLPIVIKGIGGIDVSGSGHVIVDGSAILNGPVSAGQFQRLPAVQTTTSVVPVLFWAVPFTLSQAASIVFLMHWNAFMQNLAAAGTTFGLNFSCNIDGNPLVDVSSVLLSIAAPGIINTQVENGNLQTEAVNLAIGAHVLNIFWAVNNANCFAQVASPDGANISIRKL